MPEYVDKVIGGTFRSLPEGDQEAIHLFIASDQDPTTMRPSSLRQLSEAFDRWAGKLEDVDLGDVPFVAQQYHVTLIDNISLLSAVTNSVAEGGALALFAYADSGERMEQAWDETHAAGRSMCGNAWKPMEPLPLVPESTPTVESQRDNASSPFEDGVSTFPAVVAEPAGEATIASSTFADGDMVTTTVSINLRLAPITSADRIAVLDAGEAATITGGPKEGEFYVWREVVTSEGVKGWVVEDFIEPVNHP